MNSIEIIVMLALLFGPGMVVNCLSDKNAPATIYHGNCKIATFSSKNAARKAIKEFGHPEYKYTIRGH